MLNFFWYVASHLGWVELLRNFHSWRLSWHFCCCNWTA